MGQGLNARIKGNMGEGEGRRSTKHLFEYMHTRSYSARAREHVYCLPRAHDTVGIFRGYKIVVSTFSFFF